MTEGLTAEEKALGDAGLLLCYSEAFRQFITSKKQDAVRFSIRPTNNSGAKFGMNMIGARQRELGECTTPWHGTGVRLSDGTVVVTRKSVAEKLTGASLFKKDPTSKLYWGYQIDTKTEPETTMKEIKKYNAEV